MKASIIIFLIFVSILTVKSWPWGKTTTQATTTNGEEKTNQTSNSSVKQMPLNDSVVKNTPVESQKDVAPIINS